MPGTVRAGRDTGVAPLLGPTPGRPRAERYQIREDETGRWLSCVEAPTVRVRIERGKTVSESTARSAEAGSIFLDGAAQAPPFVDSKRAVYNLDHHEGCVRAFTLATCEQALILVRRLADLRRRDFDVHANDADLDTVVAIWVLLNHLRLRNDPQLFRRIVPLVRLEGAIDAHGLDHLDLLPFDQEALARARTWLDGLLEKQSELAGFGDDLLGYVAERLRELDALVYPPTQLEELREIEELKRVPIGVGSIAIVCRSEEGIYEVESQLRRFHGERLGLVVLEKTATRYSVRQLDPSLPVRLEDLYHWLNLLDPAARGRSSGNCWGGSDEIGGSPRGTGTRLSAAQIARAIHRVFEPPAAGRRISQLLRSLCLGTGLMLLSWAAAAALGVWARPGSAPAGLGRLDPVLGGGLLLLLLAGGGWLVSGIRHPGLYGLRRPSGRDWWALLPLALAAGAAGGVLAPRLEPLDPDRAAQGQLLAALLLLPLGAEMLFRGQVLGGLAWVYELQRPGGEWLISAPVFWSSLVYTPWCMMPWLLGPLGPWPLDATRLALSAAGGFGFGLVAGVARERSESLLVPILFHLLAAAGAVAATTFL